MWGNRRKSQAAKVKFKYNTRSQTRRNKSVFLFHQGLNISYFMQSNGFSFDLLFVMLLHRKIAFFFRLSHNKVVIVEYNCFLTLPLKLLFLSISL